MPNGSSNDDKRTSSAGSPKGESAAPKIIEALREHVDAIRASEQRRQSQRVPWLQRLDIQVEGEDVHRGRTIEAIAHDISHGGVGLISDTYIEPGTAMQIVLDGLPERPTVKGVALYCLLLSSTFHHVGVQFTS